MAQASTYSFINTEAVFNGPGGSATLSFSLTEGGVAEEGISIEQTEEQGVMAIGADGTVQHSLRAATAGKMTVTVMRNNDLNLKLFEAFNIQKSSSALWGKNVITLNDTVSGESYTCSGTAFIKLPANYWKKDAEALQWEFNVGNIIATGGLNTDGDQP